MNNIYSALFSILSITSIIFHSNNNIYTNVIDKVAILLVVLYGGNELYNKSTEPTHKMGWMYFSAIIMSFFATIYLYIYGFFANEYCFCAEPEVAEMSHILIHFISSFGHHLIICL